MTPGHEVTRAGGREQPPAGDPHGPSSSQRSHRKPSPQTARPNPPWKREYFGVQMFQFNIWPSELQQRMGGYLMQEWECSQCSTRAPNSGFWDPAAPCLNEQLPKPGTGRASPLKSLRQGQLSVLCPDLTVFHLRVTVLPGRADAIATICHNGTQKDEAGASSELRQECSFYFLFVTPTYTQLYRRQGIGQRCCHLSNVVGEHHHHS